MRTDGTRCRRAVVALVAGTAVLAPAAAFGGFSAGRGLAGGPDGTAAPLPSAPLPSESASAAAPAASPSTPATELSDAARDLAARTAVRLSPLLDATLTGQASYSGSGSIVSEDGLVLTNAHVAQPTAPGLSALYGVEEHPFGDPGQLIVSLTDGDGPAQAAYRADVLAVDGYLDLAVLRIVADAEGRPLPRGVSFPFIPLGTVDDLQRGDDLTVYGYPGINGGDLLSVSPGAVRTFIPDRLGRAEANRFDIETTAEFSGGNSGGMALDNAGRLVGVPRGRLIRGEQNDVSRFVRPVDFAAPLLEASRSGAEYVSPYLVPATGREAAEDRGWSEEKSCVAPAVDALDETDDVGLGRVLLTGMAEGEDVLLVLRRDGRVVQTQLAPFKVRDPCYGISIDEQPDGGLQPGDYSMEVRVGPDRRLLLTSEVTVDPTGD